MRQPIKLLAAMASAALLVAGFCPELCLARDAEHGLAHSEPAAAPEAAPCHPASSGSDESSGEKHGDCASGCSALDRVELASLRAAASLDAPVIAALPAAFAEALSDATAVARIERGAAAALPPRDLLLVKRSLLI